MSPYWSTRKFLDDEFFILFFFLFCFIVYHSSLIKIRYRNVSSKRSLNGSVICSSCFFIKNILPTFLRFYHCKRLRENETKRQYPRRKRHCSNNRPGRAEKSLVATRVSRDTSRVVGFGKTAAEKASFVASVASPEALCERD